MLRGDLEKMGKREAIQVMRGTRRKPPVTSETNNTGGFSKQRQVRRKKLDQGRLCKDEKGKGKRL